MNGDSTHSLQPVHLVSNQLTALASHQLVGQTTATPNHYMIHLSNANSQDPQTITIEPMNGLQSLHSGNGCAFSSNDLTQLTSLNAAANEVCLDGSGINLTALSNGQLPESCLLTSDTDLCWNTILTDELGTSTVYSTNSIPLTAIPIASSSQSSGAVLSPVTDSQQTANSAVVTSSISNSISSSIGSSMSNSISNSISGSMSNAVTSSSSQSPASANLLAADNHAQVQNLILSSTTSNSIGTTSYCISTSNVDTSQFSNPINAAGPMNGQHLNGAETVVHNVVTCAPQVSAPSSISHHQPHHLSSWDANGNYMNSATINASLGALNAPSGLSSSGLSSSASLNSAATLNCASNENHGSPVVIQISSNGNCLSSDLNCAHQFDGSNSMPTWIECTLQGTLQNGKVAFESNAFDLDNFSDLDNC